MERRPRDATVVIWNPDARQRALAEAEVTRAESLERRAIRSHNIRVDRLGTGNQPSVVLAHPPRCATLQQSAPPRLGKMQSLNRKPLQRREGCSLVSRALQKLLHAYD